MTEEPKVRVVTPEQLRDGYRVGPFSVGSPLKTFSVVRKLEDGNYLVREPRA